MTTLCEQTVIFQSVKSQPFHLSAMLQDCLKPVPLALFQRPRTPVRGSKKQIPPAAPRRAESLTFCGMQGQSYTAEKLQLVYISSVGTLPMLSCLQVKLSWGICHGSSCFCI